MGDVQVDAVVAVGLHLVVDGARHDVAGGEILQRVVALHEGGAVAAPEDRTLAAHRLRDQERAGARVVQGGRVELHELHVGHGRAGAVRHGDPVAGGNVRVAGVEVDLAGPSRGKERDAGGEGLHRAALDVQHVRAQAAVFVELFLQHLRLGDEVDGDMVFVDGDVVVRQGRLDQGALDLAAGDVLGVQDAPLAVPPLAGEVVRLAARVLGELDPPLDQVGDHLGAVLNHTAHHLFVADAGAGHQGILDVGVEGVLGRGDRGDPPLRVVGGGLRYIAFGEQGNGPVGRRLQREGEPRDAATDHQKITLHLHTTPDKLELVFHWKIGKLLSPRGFLSRLLTCYRAGRSH